MALVSTGWGQSREMGGEGHGLGQYWVGAEGVGAMALVSPGAETWPQSVLGWGWGTWPFILNHRYNSAVFN